MVQIEVPTPQERTGEREFSVEFEEVPHLGELGEIRLSFQYMTVEQCLILNVHEIRKVDHKYAQLVVKSRLVNEENLTQEKVKTSIKAGRDPVYEEIFTFNKLEQHQVNKDTLMVAVFDHPTAGADRMIGEFRFRLRRMTAEHGLPRFYPLKLYKDRPKSISEVVASRLAISTPSPAPVATSSLSTPAAADQTPSTPVTPSAGEKKTFRSAKKASSHQQNNASDTASIASREDLGELLVKASYSAAQGKLTVKVLEIREPEFLVHPDTTTVYINATLPDHKQKQKTQTYPRGGDVIHPTETFTFDVPANEIHQKSVDLALKVGSTSFVGVVWSPFLLLFFVACQASPFAPPLFDLG